MRFSILILTTILYLSSCTNEKPDKIGPVIVPCTVDTAGVTYANGIQQLIKRTCTDRNCHTATSPSPGAGFANFEDITQLKARGTSGLLLKKIKHDNTSPPSMPLGFNKLTDCEILLVEQWISKGMPD